MASIFKKRNTHFYLSSQSFRIVLVTEYHWQRPWLLNAWFNKGLTVLHLRSHWNDLSWDVLHKQYNNPFDSFEFQLRFVLEKDTEFFRQIRKNFSKFFRVSAKKMIVKQCLYINFVWQSLFNQKFFFCIWDVPATFMPQQEKSSFKSQMHNLSIALWILCE